MFNRENLDQLHRLSDEVLKQKNLASELIRIAQDRHGQRKHKMMREGKEIELTEKVLWDETFYLGAGSESGQFLAKRHPSVFEAYRKQDKAAADLKTFCITTLKVDYTQMSISDYTKLTEGMFELLLTEQGLKWDLHKYFKYLVGNAVERIKNKYKK